MQRLGWFSTFAVGLSATVSTLMLLVLALLGTVDVIGTWLFSAPVPSVREISSECLAILIFFAFGYAQLKREHVAVDLFYTRFSPAVKKLADLLGLAIGLALFGLIAYRQWVTALDSLEMRETASALVAFPLYPFKFAVSVAAAVAALEFLRQLLELLLGAAPADAAGHGEAAERSM